MTRIFDRATLLGVALGLVMIVFLLLFKPVYGNCHMEGADKVCKITAWVRK